MRTFMDEDFLLSTESARKLYHRYAEGMPILDYHSHVNPREIYEDRQFENITQVWLGADHYKWRQMRANGINEAYITGDAPDYEKFCRWAKTLEMAIGNPLYHWSHLELKRYFGFGGYLCRDTAREVWEQCNAMLATADYSARGLIKMSNVRLLCTTDDPADSLIWHQRLAKDDSFDVRVLPAWRPDRAFAPEKEDYTEYLENLGEAADVEIDSFASLVQALCKRMDFFAGQGCRIADHGLEYVMYEPASEKQIEGIFAKRLAGGTLSRQEEMQFKTAFLLAMGREYHKRNWVMQLHYGVKRNINTRLFRALGADAGVDSIGSVAPYAQLSDFLNALADTDELPKTIVYSLNPADNAAIGSVIGCFQDDTVPGKIQQGSAWWFNDHKCGMREQMISLANLGLLGNFIGMLTDSRSFLSYTRHEYFRRVMCDLIGGWVEDGEYPQDSGALERIVRGISYDNAVRYFGFPVRRSAGETAEGEENAESNG